MIVGGWLAKSKIHQVVCHEGQTRILNPEAEATVHSGIFLPQGIPSFILKAF